MSKKLDRERQIEIYRVIAKNPGIHLSKIAELLNISVALADYHLYYMEEKDIRCSL